MKFAFLVLMLLPHSLEGASVPRMEEWWKVNCLPLAELDSQIRYCTENEKAVKEARACRDELLSAWKLAAVEVAEVQRLSHERGQKGELGNSDGKYQSSISRLRQLVESTRRGADLLAKYPTVMVDIMSVTSQADSLPCYQDAFRTIQKFVNDLDERAEEGGATLAAASEPMSFTRKTSRKPASTITGNVTKDNNELPEGK